MEHFGLWEFDCPCCNTNYMDHDFLVKIDLARELAGVVFNVNSGYRCLKHNIKVGGSRTSSHLVGLAADIECLTDAMRGAIIPAFYDAGLTRIGYRSDFLHVDYDLTKNQNRFWGY